MIWAQIGLGLGLAILIGLSSEELISLLGAEYKDTTAVLRILSLNIFVHSITYAMAIILIALNQQKNRTYVQIGAVVFAIVANLLVVKWAGIQGAAIVYVLSECILAVGYLFLVGQYYMKNKQKPQNIKIMLVNIHSMRNAGDAALTLETLRQIRATFV